MSTAVKGIFTIAPNGHTALPHFDKRDYARGLDVFIPTGFQGVLGILKSADGETFSPAYDPDGNLIVIDPTGKTAAWHTLPYAVYAAHYIQLQAWVDVTGAATQNQAATRTLVIMGIA